MVERLAIDHIGRHGDGIAHGAQGADAGGPIYVPYALPGEIVEVRLQAKATEAGTLELTAVSTSGGERWDIEFDVRGNSQA